MNKLISLVLLGIAASAFAFGSPVPEIDPASGGSALALLAGAVLVFRSSRRK